MDRSNDDTFDIEKVKEHLRTIPFLADQLGLLYRLKTEFNQQTGGHPSNPDHISFSNQIDLEIDFRVFESRLKERLFLKRKNSLYTSRLRVLGEVKPLALAFRALRQHRGDNGKNYLLISDYQLVDFLANVLEYADGRRVRWEHLSYLILTPSTKKNIPPDTISDHGTLEALNPQAFYQYDLSQVKYTLREIHRMEEKWLFLRRVKTNFLQHQPTLSASGSFLQQLELELIQLQQGWNVHRKEEDDTIIRIKVNGRINILMTFFYELLVELPQKYGIYSLDNSKAEIIRFIMHYFEKKNGKPFSTSFMRTTLTPSKEDKRSTSNKRVEIMSFWKKR